MANSNVFQAAASTSSASAATRSNDHCQHSGAPASAVASTILKRHVAQRQRFDSADYVMIQSIAATAAAVTPAESSTSYMACEPYIQAEHIGEPAKVVAGAIMKRHVNQRQRFDSADYFMVQSAAAAATLMPQEIAYSAAVQAEAEPEPEVSQRQQVRRIRLQRFDSADWVMDTTHSKTSASTHDASKSQAAVVAQMLLDRHAFTTCQFVTTPVQCDPRCSEKAA